MSNETDLDWLARNVHVWAEDWTHVRKCPVHHEAKWMASLSPNAEYKDWRTKQQWLTRRAELQGVTEQFKPSIEEANRLAQEFKLFTSIEENQEQEMTQQHDMKQDNGWFERGELPPVGVECDIRHSCWNYEKYEKVTVAAITNEYLIVKYATFEQHYMLKDISFRPIRTERELAIEEMKQACQHHGSWYSVGRIYAEALYDAGYRKDPK